MTPFVRAQLAIQYLDPGFLNMNDRMCKSSVLLLEDPYSCRLKQYGSKSLLRTICL
jgi:hypothetical protein